MYLAAQNQQQQKRSAPPGYGSANDTTSSTNLPNYDYNNNASATPPNSTVNDDTTNMNILNQEFTRSLGIVDNYASYPPVNKSNASRNNFQEDQAPLSSTPPSLTSSGYRAPSSSPIVFENSFLNTSPVGLSSGLNPNNRGDGSDGRSDQSDLTQMFYQQQQQQGNNNAYGGQRNANVRGNSTLNNVTNNAWRGNNGSSANTIENNNFFNSGGANAQQELLRITQRNPEQNVNNNTNNRNPMSYSYPGRGNGQQNNRSYGNNNNNNNNNAWPGNNNVNNNSNNGNHGLTLNLKSSYNNNGGNNNNLASSYPQTQQQQQQQQQRQQNAAPFPSVSPVQSQRKPLLGTDGNKMNFATPSSPIATQHNVNKNNSSPNAYTPPRRNGRQQGAWGNGNNVNNHHQQAPRTPPGGRGDTRNSRTPGGWETQRSSRHSNNHYNNHGKGDRSDSFEFQTQRRGRNRRNNKYDDRRNGSSPGGSPGNNSYRHSNGHNDRRNGRHHNMDSPRSNSGMDRMDRLEREREDYNSSPNSLNGGSTVLDKFKMDKSGREWTIDEIKGHIAMFARDRRATRFLQHRIEVADKDEMDIIYSEIVGQGVELMLNKCGNYVVKKMYEECSVELCRGMTEAMRGNILLLAQNVNGCRVLQAAIEYSDHEHLVTMLENELKNQIPACACDSNATHVLQKCLRFMPCDKVMFIAHALARTNIMSLAKHQYGCHLLQRCIATCSEVRHDPRSSVGTGEFVRMIDDISLKLVQQFEELAFNRHGNFVLQYVLQHGSEDQRAAACTYVRTNVVRYSMHKFASHLVEQCLKNAPNQEKHMLIENILRENVTVESSIGEKPAIVCMMRDPYANFVVQKMLDCCTRDQKDEVYSVVSEHAFYLKKSTYARHILARIEQQSGSGFQQIM